MAPIHILQVPDTGISLDFTEHGPPAGLDGCGPALEALAALEGGARANPDETGSDGQPGRRVGHYWLRDPARAPTGLGAEIRASWVACSELAQRLKSELSVTTVLHLGIGGSALGPQLLAEALAPVAPFGGLSARSYRVLDNIDPVGLADQLVGVELARCLVLVVSKSGSTRETMANLELLAGRFAAAKVPLAPRCVALTTPGSKLDKRAQEEGWAGSLPVWTWVGGRTSLTSSVGLFPAELLGISCEELLAGAAAMDRAGRAAPEKNPAAWLACAWRQAQRGRPRALVMLPYADRLVSLGRYLQQLIMESIGKRHDRSGNEIRAGLSVFGNKGTTDQHAFVQQLRDGPDDFLAHFLSIARPSAPDPALAGGATAGDWLFGFLLGTQQALHEDGKASLQLCLERLDARSFGALVALFERAVSLYAELLDINAYHQPGVQAGKLAAEGALAAQQALLDALDATPRGAEELAARAGCDPVLAWRQLRRLALAKRIRSEPGSPGAERFSAS